MILTMNNFEFDNNHFIQLHGTAIGMRMAPAYANLFTHDLEEKRLTQFPLEPYIWWRYINDIYMGPRFGPLEKTSSKNLLTT